MPERPPSTGEDPLARLSEQIRHTRETAQRLRHDLAAGRPPAGAHTGSDEMPPGTPPRGWAVPGPAPQSEASVETQALAAALELARALIPRELAQALSELVRELLLVARELIDAYLERSDRRAPPPPVEDIPLL